MSSRDLAWLALVCIAGLLVRLPFLTMPMIADEGGYAYATRGWLDGTGQLYDDLWISRPQGIFYLYAVIFETLGTDTVAFRLAAWISACGTAIAVWAIARRWRPPPVPALAALVFIVVSGSPSLEGYTANAEMFMMLPSAWCIWTLIKAAETEWSAHWVFPTGVLIGIATMLKPSGIVMLPVALIAILAFTRAEHRGWREPVAWLFAGLAMIGIPALIHGWLLGWDDFIYATVTYRLTMQSSATVGVGHHLAAIGRLILRILPLLILVTSVMLIAHRHDVIRILSRALRAVPAHPFRMVSLRLQDMLRHAGEPPSERHLIVPDDRIGMLLRLWVLASLTGIAMGGDWWAHYAIQIAAPFAIWFAGVIMTAIGSVTRHLKTLIVVSTITVALSPYWVIALGSTEAMSNRLFSHPGYQAQDEVAAWLRDNSEPGTPVFVAFDQAAIYYLADRPPAYRHLYDQELRALPGSYGDIISMIRSPERPLYIVSTRQPGPYPDASRTFWQEVGQYYELETMIEGIPIYRAREYTAPAP
ncbi:MAG TPA: glycosyltransferase family 39 protein [Thermomicrobiales bacterium]|nr:glycosyltransferase family 39 protein [Thermomicrobiales bacterium]